MIAGYPAGERIESKDLAVDFGFFTALGVARTVTDRQITWLMEREYQLANAKVPLPPPEYDLGGISANMVWPSGEQHIRGTRAVDLHQLPDRGHASDRG